MRALEKYRQELARLHNIRVYANRIGSPGHGEAGKLHSITCKSLIHHQPRSGATNYHDSEDFDGYLAKAVAERFEELAKRAVELASADVESLKAGAEREFIELFKAPIPSDPQP